MNTKRKRIENYVNVVRAFSGRWVMGEPPMEAPVDNEELFEWFMPALQQWLKNRAISRPTCIVCRNNIKDSQRAPQAFLLIEIDAAPGERPPKQVLFINICDYCATRGNEELMQAALRQLFGRARVPRRISDGGVKKFRDFVLGGRFTFDTDGSVHGSSPMAGGRRRQT